MIFNSTIVKNSNAFSHLNPDICKKCPYLWTLHYINNKIQYSFSCVKNNNDVVNFAVIYDEKKFNEEAFKNCKEIGRFGEIKNDFYEEFYKTIKPDIINNQLNESCKNLYIGKYFNCPYWIEHQMSNWNKEK